jgi:MYXO-CTERM domain-containing protein
MSRRHPSLIRVSAILVLLGAGVGAGVGANEARADEPLSQAGEGDTRAPRFASQLDTSWVLEDVIDAHGFRIERYGQRFEGLRVEGASAVVRARRDGVVDRVRTSSPVRAGTTIPSFVVRTPARDAIEAAIARTDVGFAIASIDASEPVLATASPFDDAPRLVLAHRVTVRSASRAEVASVLLEDGTLRVLRVEVLTHDARGLVYLRNSVSDDGMTTEVELPHQTDPGSLTNEAFTVRSCVVSAGGACTPTAHALPDMDGNFLLAPEPASFEDGFAEVMAFHHANLLADRLEADHGFRWSCPLGDDSMRIFPNFTDAPGRAYANAAFVPSTRDECGYLIFGQSGMQDFASDADVVYHELGHAVTDQLAHIVGFGVDSLGLHYDPLAVNEGTSDYWAATTQGDPHVGESLQGIDGLGRSAALRDLDGGLRCPDDLFGEGHFDGRIWAGTFWDLRTELGAEKVDALLFATVASLTTNPSLRAAGETAASTADGLAEMGTLTSADATRVREVLGARGLLDCQRITPLDDGEQRGAFSGLAILTGGLGNDVAPVHYSLEIPADARSATIEVTPGTLIGQYAVLARHGQPVGFRGPSIQRDQRDDVGHGGAVTYHGTDPAFVPCTTLYFAIESTDLDRGETIFLVQASLERSGDPSARCPDPVPDAGPPDATVPSDAFDVPDAGMGGGMTGGGCGCRVTSEAEGRSVGLVGLAAIALALFARARRRRAQR